jgi:hypothetical protein
MLKVLQAVEILFSEDVSVKFQRFELADLEIGKAYKIVKEKGRIST